MSALFAELRIRNLILKNRIVMSPMCQYSARMGFANNWHKVHYGSRAVGGAAAIIQESTAVSKVGRLTYADLGLWDDEHVDRLRKMTSLVLMMGAVPGVQLVHAGRKGSCEVPWKGGEQINDAPNGWPTVAPSPIPYSSEDNPPRELSIDAIKGIVGDFEDAATRAIEAGYKIIEVHGAHGYLVHEFLSPLSNRRKDVYGGSFENRVRFLLEIIDRLARLMTDDLSLWVRISARDWMEGGWDLDDSVRLATLLKERGVDVVDVSSGGNVPAESVREEPCYQVPFAERIKRETGMLTGTVGMITDARQAEQILKDGRADLILIGRELLRDPYFTLKAAEQLGSNTPWPVQYERARQHITI